MRAPRWAAVLLRHLATPGRAEDVVGDLEESYRRRVQHRGRLAAELLTALEALDIAVALLRERAGRWSRFRHSPGAEATLAPRGRTGRTGMGISWLDLKLGFRMLVKYPGLTLVGGVAMAFAICVGAGTFGFLSLLVSPTLPLDDGDRVVAVRNWDAAENRAEPQVLHDFVSWREELRSIEDLGAYRDLERNLMVEEGRAEPVRVAEISASAFRVARVPPHRGRTLNAQDEEPGAPAVLVIGYDVWQSRFGGDPDVVGRTVRLGSTQSTVVGVMPEGFEFPRAHDAWTPLWLNPLDYVRGEGPGVRVFGRLARGFSLDEAQAELTALGRRAAADFPRTHEHLRPQVMPYARSFFYSGVSGWAAVGLMSSNVVVVIVLALICANVALLMFARAATREGELVVRTALGASRRRIIAQLFAEALVLGVFAAILGLAAARFGLDWALGIAEAEFMDGGGRLPFWFRATLSPATMLYAALLTVVGAAIAGVMPALKVTRGVGTRLRQATAGGGGLRFGGLWTAVIVTQVAITVVFPAVSFSLRGGIARIRDYELGFADEEYLSVRLELDRETAAAATGDTSRAAFQARFAAVTSELERQLLADPAVTDVTFADVLPRTYHGWNQIEVDEGAVMPRDSIRGHRVSAASIDPNYFAVLNTPIRSGRPFHSGDVDTDARAVIVNQPFVDRVLGGANPVGRRLRYIAGESARAPGDQYDPGPWYEIVGVVRDLGTTSGYGRAGFYHPLPSRGTHPVYMVVHVRSDPASFAPELRSTAMAVDYGLRLEALMPLDEVANEEIKFYEFWYSLAAGMTAVALLLSLAGVYAVMSFTVSRRTREIGIRVALGADPRRIALAIFRRPLAQVGLGVMVGAGLVAGLMLLARGGALPARHVASVVAYAALMMGVCMLACVVPTRRALRVEPTEALKDDA